MSSAPARMAERFKKPMQVIKARSTGRDFNIDDRRVFNILHAMAYRDLPTRTIHRIQMRQLSDALAQGQSLTMDEIRESLDRLFHGEIEIHINDEVDGESVIRCHYLSTQRPEHDDGWLDYAFDQILLRYLKNPKVYSMIQLATASSFGTSHALRLYELMVHKYSAFDRAYTMSLEEAYDFFEVKEGENNHRIDQFKKRVVDKAIDEVNRRAEFDVSVEYERFGRGGRMVGMTFAVTPKSEGRIAATLQGGRARRPRHRDERTVDLFDGRSDAEVGSLVLGPETEAAARDLVGPAGDVAEFFEEWKEEYRLSGYSRNPDEKFLAWLRLTMLKRQDHDLEGMDVNAIFDNLLGEG